MKKRLTAILIGLLLLCPMVCLATEPGSETGVASETEPAHEHHYEWVTDREPTCTQAGSKHEECTALINGVKCGEKRNENTAIPAKSHTLTATAAKEATCTQEGNIAYWVCAECKTCFLDAAGKTAAAKEQTVLPKTEHSYSWVTDREATETTAGLKHEQCTVCGARRSENTEIPATGSAATEHIHNLKKVEAKEASCVQEGNIEYWFCAECARYFRDDQGKTEIQLKDITIAKAEHQFVWVEDQPATAEATGLKHEECTVCGEKQAENTVVPFLDHVHNLIRVEASEPTCIEQGNLEYYICTECALVFLDKDALQETTVEAVKLPKTGHTPITTEDGRTICLICGAAIVAVEEPRLLTGANQVWVRESESGISFQTNILPDYFKRILVDGVALEEDSYAVEGEEKLTLTLNADFLSALTKGQHTVNIEAENGEVATLFTVSDGNGSSSHGWIVWVVVILLIPVPEIPNIIRLIKGEKTVR